MLGVAFLVSMGAGRQPAPDVPGSPQRGLAAYLLVSMGAMAIASVLQITTHTRVDHLVYGRYNEGFLPVLLVAGGAWLFGPATARARLSVALRTVAAILLLATVVVTGNGPAAFYGDIASINVLGALMMDRISPDHFDVVLRHRGGVDRGDRPRRRLASPPCRRCHPGGHGLPRLGGRPRATVTAPVADVANHRYVLAPQVDWFADAGVPVSYDLAAHDLLAANRYRFQLMGRPFVFFDSAAGEEPVSGVVIASRSWGEHRAAGRMVSAEPDHDQALWIVEPTEPAEQAPV
ncbi:MAG TPA: hypothetical protein VGR26_08225 [Acidimicrobiales bacterium]|nr:hypothetical protein [Acidimicrobiales bacterium]